MASKNRSARSARSRSLIIAAIALVLVGILLYAFADDLKPVPNETEYKGAGFSFMHSTDYRLVEYSRNAASIVDRDGDESRPIVEAVVYRNDRDTAAPPSYRAFVEQQALSLCGADNGVENVTCSAVTLATTTTAGGHVGQRLSMTLTRTSLSAGTTTVGAFEPIYVFNLGASDAPSPTGPRYKALFIYPSLSAVLAGSTDPEELQLVIDTLKGEDVPLSATASTTAPQQ